MCPEERPPARVEKPEAAQADDAPGNRPPSEPADAAERRWREAVDRLRNRRRELAGELLQHKHDIGRLAVELCGERAERLYGHRLGDLAGAIGEISSTILDCMRFADSFSPEQLEELKRTESPWRTVLDEIGFCNPELRRWGEADDREAAGRRRRAVEERRRGGRKRGGCAPDGDVSSAMRSFNALASRSVSEILPEFLVAVRKYGRVRGELDPAAELDLARSVEQSSVHLGNLRRLLGRAAELVEELGAADADPDALGGRRRDGRAAGPPDRGADERTGTV